MDAKTHILVVDDDDRLRTLIKKYLSEQGFMVTAAADAAEARRKLAWYAFDLAVLDVMMPGESGLELLESLKSHPEMPVLMLSAMGEAEDRIRGLEIGAEDYMAKPFEPKELVLRLNALLKRRQAHKDKNTSIRFGPYHFDWVNGQLMRGDEVIALTSNETLLLKLLAEHPSEPLSREQLLKNMPGVANERAVDVQVTRLRKKIEESAGKPQYLKTVRGAGYVLYAD